MDPVKRQNLLQLITLLGSPGVGIKRALELVQVFGSAEAVMAAPAGEIEASTSLNLECARSIVKTSKSFNKAEKILEDCEKYNANLVTYWEDDYPTRLKSISDPPLVLFIKGDMSPLFDYSIAIVGTRTPSEHGKKITGRLATELAGSGVTIVSGMALGIDSEAHLGALRAGGRTIAVLGCGVDVVYPSSNQRLYGDIVEQGAIFSEYPPGTSPDKNHFPRRNRIISGLSLGTVVVEAGMKSGALITANLAIEQGRELLAVPGAAGAPRSAGVNHLLKQGAAIMVENAKEIVDHLRSQLAPVMNVKASMSLPNLGESEKVVYDLLEAGPMGVDDLIRQGKIGAVELNRLITSMQLKGILRRYPGARIGRA